MIAERVVLRRVQHLEECRRRIAAAYRLENSVMLGLDAIQVRLQILRALQPHAYALAGDEKAPEEFQKALELRIARRLGNREMELEVLADGGVAALECEVDGNVPVTQADVLDKIRRMERCVRYS